jgi:hypothetical protein
VARAQSGSGQRLGQQLQAWLHERNEFGDTSSPGRRALEETSAACWAHRMARSATQPVAHPAGGRKVAGSNPVAPTERKPAPRAGSRHLGGGANGAERGPWYRSWYQPRLALIWGRAVAVRIQSPRFSPQTSRFSVTVLGGTVFGSGGLLRHETPQPSHVTPSRVSIRRRLGGTITKNG